MARSMGEKLQRFFEFICHNNYGETASGGGLEKT